MKLKYKLLKILGLGTQKFKNKLKLKAYFEFIFDIWVHQPKFIYDIESCVQNLIKQNTPKRTNQEVTPIFIKD